MMKILILNYEFPPIGGGAGHATYNIAKKLVELGHRVDVITSGYKTFKRFQVLDGIRVYKVNTHRKSIYDAGMLAMSEYVIRAWSIYKKLVKKNRYDVVHSFFSIPTGIIAYLGKKKYKNNYILSLRGSDVPGYDKTQLQIVHKLSKNLNMKVWENASRIIALSDGLKKIALESKQIRISKIPNGIDACKFKPIRQNKQTKDKTLRLVSVCRLLKRKGIQDLLHAIKDLKDVELDIYGIGNYEHSLKKLAKQLSLTNVAFKGNIEHDKLPEILSKYDCFVLPSYTESFGMVFVEAMACGLPIIATNIGGIPEIISKDNGILIAPGDIKAIRNAITHMQKNPKLRKHMSKSNIKKVKTKFSWDKVAKKYLEEYKKIQNKRILMISPQPFFEPRGTPLSVFFRARALSELGYHVDIATYPIGKNKRIKNVNIIRAKNLGFKKIKIGPSLSKIPLDFMLFIRSISLLKKNRYDYIHVHEEASVFGLVLKKMFKIPMIYDMHSSMPDQLHNYNFTKNKLLYKLFSFLEKKVLKNSDAVIVVCKNVLKKAKKHTKNIHLIENTSTFDRKIDKNKIRNLKKQLGAEKLLVYTGTFEFNQGIDLLIKSIKYVKTNVKLILVGGKPKQIKNMKRLAKKLNIKNIRFAGQKSPSTALIYEHAADALISTRIKGENTPLKVYSYLKSNVPIIATRISAHTKVFNDKNCILVSAHPRSIAKGIDKALTDKKVVRSILKEAKIISKEKYSEAQYLKLNKKVYESIR